MELVYQKNLQKNMLKETQKTRLNKKRKKSTSSRPSTHTACVVWNLEHRLHAAFLAQNFFTGLLLFTQWPKYDWIHMQTEVKNKITLESTAIYHF